MRFLVIASLSLTAVVSKAQITGVANSRDPRAIVVTDEQKKSLIDKNWYCVGVEETHRGISETWDRRGFVNFLSDGNIRGPIAYGQWSLEDNRLLRISVVETNNFKPLLAGAYSIYELTDSTLLLGQIVTSSGDWKREFHFSTSAPPFQPLAYFPQPASRDDTLKAGTVTTRHPNGKTASVRHFEEHRFKGDPKNILSFYSGYHYDPKDTTWFRVIEASSLWYDTDGRLTEVQRYDTTGRHWATEYYHHRTEGKSPIIARYRGKKAAVYVVGGADSIELDRIALTGPEDIGIAGGTLNKQVRLTNINNKVLKVNVEANQRIGLASHEYQIDPGGSLDIPFSITRPEGEVDEKVWIRMPDGRVYFDIRLVGYHIRCSDFSEGARSSLPSKFFLQRDADAFQMIIKSTNGSVKEKTSPISKQVTSFDLKKGLYEFTLVSPSARTKMDVEVK